MDQSQELNDRSHEIGSRPDPSGGVAQADPLHRFESIHAAALGISGMFSRFLPRDNTDSDLAMHHLILMMEHVELALGIAPRQNTEL